MTVVAEEGRAKTWKNNIKEWIYQSLSFLLRIADDRNRWTSITAEVSVGVPNDARMSRKLAI